MELDCIRQWFTPHSTISELSVDGLRQCYILEDAVRTDPNPATPVNEGKVYGRTAIPAGRYRVVITMSNRFKRPLPLLIGVPGYTGVRIHPGNTEVDTLGCLLTGITKAPDYVGHSREAFAALFEKMELVAKDPSQEIWINIKEMRQP